MKGWGENEMKCYLFIAQLFSIETVCNLQGASRYLCRMFVKGMRGRVFWRDRRFPRREQEGCCGGGWTRGAKEEGANARLYTEISVRFWLPRRLLLSLIRHPYILILNN